MDLETRDLVGDSAERNGFLALFAGSHKMLLQPFVPEPEEMLALNFGQKQVTDVPIDHSYELPGSVQSVLFLYLLELQVRFRPRRNRHPQLSRLFF